MRPRPRSIRGRRPLGSPPRGEGGTSSHTAPHPKPVPVRSRTHPFQSRPTKLVRPRKEAEWDYDQAIGGLDIRVHFNYCAAAAGKKSRLPPGHVRNRGVKMASPEQQRNEIRGNRARNGSQTGGGTPASRAPTSVCTGAVPDSPGRWFSGTAPRAVGPGRRVRGGCRS